MSKPAARKSVEDTDSGHSGGNTMSSTSRA